ncbi:MAG: phosphatase family protein [Solirubrobacterales bacterium]|nr:phosphatase family protein [Solirubrobacterales bacterium]
MELSILHTLNNFLARHDGLSDPIERFATASQLLFIVALVAALVWRPTRRSAVIATIATPMALVAGAILSAVVTRARPFVDHPEVHRLISHAADPGFPSDHATASFAIATALLFGVRKVGVGLLAVATLLAVARVAVGVHWPTDVLAGAALGVAGACVARALWELVCPRLEARWQPLGALLDAPARPTA